MGIKGKTIFITGAVAIAELDEYEGIEIFDKDRLVLVNDHYCPNKDVPSAEQCKSMRDFARKHDLKYFQMF